MLSRPYIYGDGPPGYPIIRIRFGTDHDIRAEDNSNDQEIGNAHDGLTPYLWVAIVLPITLLAAWGIVEALLAYGGWIARDEIRERTRRQIADFPRQIYELKPAINLMDKKRFMSASCYYTKPPGVHPVCAGGQGGEGFGESDEHYVELIKRVEFNAQDHRTRYVTAALILACTYANKPLLADICVSCLSDIAKDMDKKGILELYANYEIAFHLISYWFLTMYYDEVVEPREDGPLPPFAFVLLRLDEMTKLGYLGSIDPTFLPAEFTLKRDDVHYYPIEVEAIVDIEEEEIEDMIFLSCDNVAEARRKLIRRVYGHMRASNRPHKLRLFMKIDDEETGKEVDYSMQIMADRFRELTNQHFHFRDLLLPEKAVFHIGSSQVAKPDLDYDQFLMCDRLRDMENSKERTVQPLDNDKSIEKSQAFIVAHIVFLFDIVLKESQRSPAIKMLLTLCNSAGSAGRNTDKLQKAVLGHCWMTLITNMHFLIDASITEGAKRDLRHIGKCFAEVLWDSHQELVTEYQDLLISLEGLESLTKTKRSLRSWRPKGSDAELESDEEDEKDGKKKSVGPPSGVPVYDGNQALEILNLVYDSHSDPVPRDGKRPKSRNSQRSKSNAGSDDPAQSQVASLTEDSEGKNKQSKKSMTDSGRSQVEDAQAEDDSGGSRAGSGGSKAGSGGSKAGSGGSKAGSGGSKAGSGGSQAGSGDSKAGSSGSQAGSGGSQAGSGGSQAGSGGSQAGSGRSNAGSEEVQNEKLSGIPEEDEDGEKEPKYSKAEKPSEARDKISGVPEVEIEDEDDEPKESGVEASDVDGTKKKKRKKSKKKKKSKMREKLKSI